MKASYIIAIILIGAAVWYFFFNEDKPATTGNASQNSASRTAQMDSVGNVNGRTIFSRLQGGTITNATGTVQQSTIGNAVQQNVVLN